MAETEKLYKLHKQILLKIISGLAEANKDFYFIDLNNNYYSCSKELLRHIIELSKIWKIEIIFYEPNIQINKFIVEFI